MTSEDTRNRILLRFTADRAQGLEHDLGHYLTLFPGEEQAVREEWQAIVADEPLAATVVESRPVIDCGQSLGRFRLGERLGRGGQGFVFAAEDEELGRPVAIKVLDQVGAMSSEAMRRLEREARVAARLDHPGLVLPLEIGCAGGWPFLVMRRVRGVPLDRVLAALRRPEALETWSGDADEGGARRLLLALSQGQLKAAWHFLRALTEAVAVAHEAGIVHRDLKPANVMVTPDGMPVVLDFGLARDLEPGGATLTRSEALLGTPAYLAPERLKTPGRPPDPTEDVHALGILAHELVTGRRPFEQPDREALFRAVLEEELPDPQRFQPRLDGDGRRVLWKACARDPRERYVDAMDFARDLAALEAGAPVSARPAGPLRRQWRRLRRHPWRTVAAVTTLVALVVGGQLFARWPEVQAARRQELMAARTAERLAAWELLSEGRLTEAEAVFHELRRADAGDLEAWAGEALARLEDEGAGAALETLELLGEARHAPPLAVLTMYLGAAVGGQEQRPTASDVTPSTGLGWFLYGRAALGHTRTGRLRGAVAARALRRALLAPEAAPRHVHLALAEALGHVRDRELAEDLVALFDATWPEDPRRDHWCGLSLLRSAPQVAMQRFVAQWALGPDLATAEHAFGLALREGLSPTAATWLQRAKEAGLAKNDQIRWEVRQLDAEGDSAAALRRHRELPEAERAHPRAALVEGRLLLRLQRHVEALGPLRRAVAGDPHFWNAHASLGRAAARLGRVEEAVHALGRAVALEPRAYEPHCDDGLLHLALRHDARAREVLEAARDLASERGEWRLPLAQVYLFQGELEAAQATLRGVPPSATALVGRVARAIVLDQTLETGEVPAPEQSEDAMLLAVLLEARGRLKEAADLWGQARRAPTGSPMDHPYVRRTLCLLRAGPDEGTDPAEHAARVWAPLRRLLNGLMEASPEVSGPRGEVLRVGLQRDLEALGSLEEGGAAYEQFLSDLRALAGQLPGE